MNRPKWIKEIKSIITYLLKHKASDPDRFAGEFYQTLTGRNYSNSIPKPSLVLEVLESAS